MRQKGFTPIFIVIFIAVVGMVGYFAYKNYISLKGAVLGPYTPSPIAVATSASITTGPTNNQNVVTQPTGSSTTCENALEDINNDTVDLITISKASTSKYCELTFKSPGSSYSLSFPEGYHVRFTGADVSAAIGFYKQGDPPEKIIYVIPMLLANNSSLDLTQPEKITVQYDESQSGSIITNKEQVIDKQIKTIGENQVLVLTLDDTAINGGDKGLNYKKAYYLINRAKMNLYSFEINSNSGKFDLLDDVNRISIVESMIASLKY